MKKNDVNNSYTGKLGKLGVRSVIYMLHMYHGILDLTMNGCKNYHVYEVEDINLQFMGVDVIEEWDDVEGKHHRKAHEVKTETPTFQTYTGRYRQFNYWGDYVRGFLSGTGNLFCETIQNGGEGWYSRYKRNKEQVDREFTDGRSIWAVAYRPREKNIPIAVNTLWCAQMLGEEMDQVRINGSPLYLLSRSDGFLMMEIPFDNFMRVTDKYIQNHKGNLRRVEGGSEGYTIPWDQFYRRHFYTDDGEIVFGVEDGYTGAKIFYDGETWLREKKNFMEPWTEKDFEPVDISI